MVVVLGSKREIPFSVITVLVVVSLLVLVGGSVTAVSFEDSDIRMGVAEMEWCVDNPFGKEKWVQKSWLTPYFNLSSGSEPAISLYRERVEVVETPYCVPKMNCHQEPSLLPNESGVFYEVCEELSPVCGVDKESVLVRSPLTDGDLLVGDRLCVKANKKAEKDFSVDINYAYDDGVTSWTTEQHGFAWWNASCSSKLNISVAADARLSACTYFPIKVVLNSSNVDVNIFDSWNVSFVDSTETTELGWWNETAVNVTGNSLVYVNVSVCPSAQSDLWMYYNCSFYGSPSFNDTFNDLDFFVSMNDDAVDHAHGLSTTGNSDPEHVYNQSDIVERLYGHFDYDSDDAAATVDYHNYTVHDWLYPGSGDFTLNFWVFIDKIDVGEGDWFLTDRIDAGTDYLQLYTTSVTTINMYQRSSAPPDEDGLTCTTSNLTGAWHMVTAVKNDTDGVIYVDGSLCAYEADFNVDQVNMNSDDWWIGSLGTDPAYGGHDGRISDVRMHFGRAYSWDEINLTFDQPELTFSGEENYSAPVPAPAVACNLSYVDPCRGCRYMTDVIESDFACANDSSTIVDCYYSINDFANVYPDNCSWFNISAELGWNEFYYWYNDSTGNYSNVSMNFWAKKQDAQWADYAVIIFAMLLAIIMMFFGWHSGMGICYMLSAVGWMITGVHMYAFAPWIGAFVLMISVFMCVLIFIHKEH